MGNVGTIRERLKDAIPLAPKPYKELLTDALEAITGLDGYIGQIQRKRISYKQWKTEVAGHVETEAEKPWKPSENQRLLDVAAHLIQIDRPGT